MIKKHLCTRYIDYFLQYCMNRLGLYYVKICRHFQYVVYITVTHNVLTVYSILFFFFYCMCELLQCCWLGVWLRDSILPMNREWMEWNHPFQNQINTTLRSFICWVWCATVKWNFINRKCLIMLFPASLLTWKHFHINRQK